MECVHDQLRDSCAPLNAPPSEWQGQLPRHRHLLLDFAPESTATAAVKASADARFRTEVFAYV